MRAFEDGCALRVGGVAVVRVFIVERKARFVFVKEFEVGLGEEARAEGLGEEEGLVVVVRQNFLGRRRGVRFAEGLHRREVS